MIGISDTQLCVRAQRGDKAAAETLIRRNEPVIAGEARLFYIAGADTDDVRQEARIGLLKAIRLFDPSRGVPFDRYLRMSIRRQLIAAMKSAARLKHHPLTYATRSGKNSDDEYVDITELLPAADATALETLDLRATIRELGRKLRVALSEREAHSLILFANGATYADIQRLTGLDSVKAVDRALCRARWKLAGVGPPSHPNAGDEPVRIVDVCPSCHRETVLPFVEAAAPDCHVCSLRRIAA